jgi:hypothetical protein
MRRDAYAPHVKAKHMKEIGMLLLDDFKEYNATTISAYASELSVKSMPIYSKMYQDAEYWFGVKPLFYIRESLEIAHEEGRPDTKLKGYPEDLALSAYLQRQENLTAHRQFIQEVLQSISLLDFIALGKDLVIKHPDVMMMKKELSALRTSHKELEESSKKEAERLKRELEMWKETADEKEFIADLRSDLQSSRSYVRQLEKSSTAFREELEFVKKENDDRWAGLNQSRFIEVEGLYSALEKSQKESAEWKEKYHTKVKVEAQKIADKDREAKQKAKDKKALEKAKAKKLAKKAKKLAELSDSGSDSDSD